LGDYKLCYVNLASNDPAREHVKEKFVQKKELMSLSISIFARYLPIRLMTSIKTRIAAAAPGAGDSGAS